MNKDKDDAERMLQQAYGLQDDTDMQAFYRDWAENYDSTMMNGLAYLTPARTSQLLAHWLADREAAIIDIGCGTGLAGAELANQGYRVIDGLDFSGEMLAVARRSGVYRDLLEADLNRPLDIASQSYAAMICTGTFTHAHVGAACLDELFRVLKPNGLFACTVHLDVWEPAGFAEKTEALEQAGTIETLVRKPGPYYADSPKDDGEYILWRKTGQAAGVRGMIR